MSRAFLFLCVVALAGCGNKIGDECTDSRDCSPEGDRVCDNASPGGYCTQLNCDFDTCPEDSVCIRFFPVTHLTKECASQEDCTLDELCTSGKCAPRSTERRFCMLKCGDHDDCRERYECRDAERIAAHGGEPVPDPNVFTSVELEKFCAPTQGCTSDADCSFGDSCVLGTAKNFCEP